MALIALQFAAGANTEIVVVGGRDSEDTRKMLDYIRSRYDSGQVVMLKDPAEEDRLAEVAPFTRDLTMLEGKATVYICRNFACEQPVNSIDELKVRLK